MPVKNWSGVSFREYRSGDEIEIVKLYNRVFSAQLSVNVWRWKYESQIDGPSVVSVAESAGELVAHVGLLVRSVVIDGKLVKAFHAVDAMVDERFRHRQLMWGLIEHSAKYQGTVFGIPYEETIPGLAYAVLNVPHQHASVRYANEVARFYLPIDNVVGYEPAKLSSTQPPRVSVSIQKCAEGFGQDDCELWQQTVRDIGWTTNRDKRYLLWRYTKRPNIQYEVMRVVIDGKLEALVILHDGWFDAESLCVEPRLAMVDAILPATNYHLLPAILREIESVGQARGRRPYLWSSPRHRFTKGVLDSGWVSRETSYKFMGFILFPAKWTLEQLAGCPYQLIGDSEIYGVAD